MSNPINIEAEVRDIKQHLIDISKKIDELKYDREIISIMKLSEKSLADLFEHEEDLYKISDVKVKYR